MYELKDTQFKGSIGGVAEFDTKQLSENGEFEGYASIYGNIDLGGDIVQAGAFDESLRTRGANKVKMLLHHDTRRVIGVWDQISSDAKGLFVKGHLMLGVQDGKETHELMKAGALDGLSIGYRTQDYSYDRDNEIRTILKAELMETSIVTFPMNQQAMISAVKGEQGIQTIRDFEQFLREEGGFSAGAAKSIAASGFKSDLRDEADTKLNHRDDVSTSSQDDIEALEQFAAMLRA